MEELSEKQVRASVRATVGKAVRDAASRGAGISLEECVARAERDLDDKILGKRLPYNGRTRTSAPRVHSDFVRSAEGIIRDEACGAYRKACASGRVRAISAATATAVCTGHLRDAGLTGYGFTCQTYRLRVWAELPSGRKLHFSIRYRCLEEDLSRVRECLEAAVRLSGMFDRDTCIR